MKVKRINDSKIHIQHETEEDKILLDHFNTKINRLEASSNSLSKENKELRRENSFLKKING